MLSKGNNYIEPNATRLRAVDNGYFYAGKQDTDPTITANQIPVYYVDESGESLIQEQPIKLNKAGVPVLKNGQSFNPVIGEATYSFSLFDKLGNQIEYDGSAESFATKQYVINTNLPYVGSTAAIGLNLSGLNYVIHDDVLYYLSENSNETISLFNLNADGELVINDSIIALNRDIFDLRGINPITKSVINKINADGFYLPTSRGVDSGLPINNALKFANEKNGAKVVTASRILDQSTKIQIPHGCSLEGTGNPMTFDADQDSTVLLFTPVNDNDIAVQLGVDGESNNRGCVADYLKLKSVVDKKGVGFSTVNRALSPNGTANTIKSSIDYCTAYGFLVGFDSVDSWNNERNYTTAIECDTGHRISGDNPGQGGGTSNTYIGSLSYQCRIGWDFKANGTQYSTFISCGSDNCQIGLRLGGASNRGTQIIDFGIEGVQVPEGEKGYGVLVDYTGSGSYTIDGLHFGVMDSSDITFIQITNSVKLVFKNVDVPSSVLGSCNFLDWSNESNAGQVTFYDSSIFANDPTQIENLFAGNVTLINTSVAARLYKHAVGGIDHFAQEVTYTEPMASSSNNRIYSKKQVALSTFERIFTGTPIFNSTTMVTGDYFEIINQSGNQMGFRSEDILTGSGIVRDESLSPATTIYIQKGETLKLQKRSDGKLYQIA